MADIASIRRDCVVMDSELDQTVSGLIDMFTKNPKMMVRLLEFSAKVFDELESRPLSAEDKAHVNVLYWLVQMGEERIRHGVIAAHERMAENT